MPCAIKLRHQMIRRRVKVQREVMGEDSKDLVMRTDSRSLYAYVR